ncbi:unnamed protein product [Bursaphelenchus xylophilus]|uniref:(pine wood nematode) hypothetical protein n=1 Tax=Bursaphelenchus xylophilus TaxID=6326 RepID=A0A1I7S3J8_BURXY|nr:unnamed protein product [Bursaphelenchus xylophilus]CAG9116360.1 unnamed protein product [Bursaphelenchus xylophilus]
MDSKVIVVQVSKELNLDERINDGTVTKRWILETLHGKSNRFDRLRHEHSVQKIVYTSKGDNENNLFDGRVAIHFDGTKKLFEVCMKRDDSLSIQQDIKFYKFIGERYKNMRFPKIYGYKVENRRNGRRLSDFFLFDLKAKENEESKEKGCVLMGEFEGVTCEVGQGFSINQSLHIMVEMARFHAFTLYIPDSNKVLKEFKKDGRHLIHREDLLDLIKGFDQEYYNANKSSFSHLMKEAAHTNLILHGIPNVIIHGSLCTDSIYLRKNQNGHKEGDTISFVDWSKCHTNLGMVDVIRFTLVNTSSNVQKMCMERFLKIHHDTMKIELKKYKVSFDYDFESVKQTYRAVFPIQLVYSITRLINSYKNNPKEDAKVSVLDRIKGGVDIFKKLYDC